MREGLSEVISGKGPERRLVSEAESFSRSIDRLPRESRIRAVKVLRAFSLGTLAVVGALAAGIQHNHARTRYEITRTENASGERAYHHEDATTSAILDYITGKAPLREDLRIFAERAALRELVKTIGETLGEDIPLSINAMNHGEVREAAIALHEKISFGDPVKEAEEYLAIATSEWDFDPAAYAAIWEVHKKTGAPRLRFADAGTDMSSFLMHHLAGAGRAFYDPVSNTLYLDPLRPGPTLLGENAHALQFHTAPHDAYGRMLGDLLHALPGLVTNAKGMAGSYRENYHREGSFEQEAHGPLTEGLTAAYWQAYRENDDEGKDPRAED
jgi:hypothetical protein